MFKEREYWAVTFDTKEFNTQKIVGIEFDDCTFKRCDFKETQFVQCRFIDCNFIDCNMNVVRFSGTRFETTHFKRCKLNGVDWTMVDYAEFLSEAPFSFYESVLDYSSFFGLKLENLSLKQCRLIEVDFREAELVGINLENCELTKAQFRHTNLSAGNLVEAMDYEIDLRINTITGAKFSREEALSLLTSLDIILV